MTSSLADRLGLHGKPVKITVKGINTEEVFYTRNVEFTVKPGEHQNFEPFHINPFDKESLDISSDILNVQALQRPYPDLAVLDMVIYSYKDLEMILVQDVYHAMRPLENFCRGEAFTRCRTLTNGLVLNGPLLSSS